MKVRMGRGVKRRSDAFGGIIYVPTRDDFFAANESVYALIKTIPLEWREVLTTEIEAVRSLSRLGICETVEPVVPQEAYSGPSFLGVFPEIPTVTEPLVVNCFATAHCPLRCLYCHADDLMTDFREAEKVDDLDNVISTANMIPSMVAVITGGDPLTRPIRTIRLIESLAGRKSLVMDTSGAGDIDQLIDVLTAHDVHVRVSLDSISEINDKVRPINRRYLQRGELSRILAEQTITRCLAAGLNVTVQTVVSSRNESIHELRDLRDWLLSRGVKNWVLHVAVRGGSARRLEKEARRKLRPRGILPSSKVYSVLWQLVDGTMQENLPIDIRCTDTDTSPNSVLLVGSKGDLFTEGYAHDGKVILYSAGQARPDLLGMLWPHLDRFGHARRYLNWNPWFYEGRSLETICVEVPVQASGGGNASKGHIVETEAKYAVTDPSALVIALQGLGFSSSELVDQRDEYFDFSDNRLRKLDFVIRIRVEGGRIFISLKGPRFYVDSGESSRIELEFVAKEALSLKADLESKQLEVTWFFEKRRTSYTREDAGCVVMIDEVPEIGYFVEIEGPLDAVRAVMPQIKQFLGGIERRNYRDLFVESKRAQGVGLDEIKGASFRAG